VISTQCDGPYRWWERNVETVAADVHVGSEIQRVHQTSDVADDEDDDKDDDSSDSVVENHHVSPMRLLDQPLHQTKTPPLSTAATAAGGVDISINSELSRASSSPSEPGE